MKLSTWSWIMFFPKSNRNLRGTLESSEKKLTISWSKPRVSFENSRGLGSDNVPAASLAIQDVRFLNKKQPSNSRAMSTKSTLSTSMVFWFFQPLTVRPRRWKRRSRRTTHPSAANSPETVAADPMFSGRALVNFSGTGTPDRKKEGNQLERRWQVTWLKDVAEKQASSLNPTQTWKRRNHLNSFRFVRSSAFSMVTMELWKWCYQLHGFLLYSPPCWSISKTSGVKKNPFPMSSQNMLNWGQVQQTTPSILVWKKHPRARSTPWFIRRGGCWEVFWQLFYHSSWTSSPPWMTGRVGDPGDLRNLMV